MGFTLHYDDVYTPFRTCSPARCCLLLCVSLSLFLVEFQLPIWPWDLWWYPDIIQKRKSTEDLLLLRSFSSLYRRWLEIIWRNQPEKSENADPRATISGQQPTLRACYWWWWWWLILFFLSLYRTPPPTHHHHQVAYIKARDIQRLNWVKTWEFYEFGSSTSIVSLFLWHSLARYIPPGYSITIK